VHRNQVPFEDVRTVEALLNRAIGPRAESAHHGALIMYQSVPVLVVLASKAFGVVFACQDWALLRTLVLVCEHVRPKVFEVPTACRVWAKNFAELVRRWPLAVPWLC
jgi:hypothetical protein